MKIPNPQIPSQMEHNFARVPKANITRSVFDTPYRYISVFNADYLIPVYCDEVLPGDTFDVRKLNMLARYATLEKPIMDNVKFDLHFWYVPKRILWTNFVKQQGEQNSPGDSTDYLSPVCTTPVGGYGVKSLQDYMGLRPEINYVTPIVNYWPRAYNLIWNEAYRDQNLQTPVTVDKGDGPDTASNYVLLKRGKRHDYFTSCLPWPQKGSAVTLLGGANLPIVAAPVSGTPKVGGQWRKASDGTLLAPSSATLTSMPTGHPSYPGNMTFDNQVTIGYYDPNGTLKVDTSSSGASTINGFRYAFQLQMALEIDARSGTRYEEMLWGQFGVLSPDFRLQNPEFLGGHTIDMNIMPVAQTSESGTTAQANLSGMGVLYTAGRSFTKSFVEHGVILGLLSSRADLTYQQGNRAMWYRRTRFDDYMPVFAHIGEQPVYNREIFVQGTSADNEVFGYNEAWSSYRYMPSLITATMRSDVSGSLDVWHLGQDFASLPVLNASFIQSNTPNERVIAVPTEAHYTLDLYMNIRKTRGMPVYSVPGLVTRL